MKVTKLKNHGKKITLDQHKVNNIIKSRLRKNKSLLELINNRQLQFISDLIIKQAYIIKLMSIYSGFATRNQQNYYDQVLYNVISTLLTRIAKFYHNENIDQNSFLKIVTNQQKTLRKLQKRKYLQPKYAQLLEYFINAISGQTIQPRKKQMNRTLSVLDRQFNIIREANERFLLQQKGDAHSLTKIQQKVKKSRKKSKSKKNSIKSNLDIFEFKVEKKMPQLPSLQPLQHLITRSKFNTKIDFSQIQSRQISHQISDEQDQIPDRSERKASLAKPPKFRAKMYFRQR